MKEKSLYLVSLTWNSFLQQKGKIIVLNYNVE